MSQDLSEGEGAVPTEVREYNPDKLKELAESGDYDYAREKAKTPSFIQRALDYIAKIISSFFDSVFGTPVGRIMLYAAGFVLLIFAISRLFGISGRDVFYKSSGKVENDFEYLEENIHSIDFDKLLEEALSKNDFKLAIRLTYLKTLKVLSDRLVVNWQAGKTNYEYLYEINQPTLREPFRTISYHFDYAWYGDFEVNEQIYNLTREQADFIDAKAIKHTAEE